MKLWQIRDKIILKHLNVGDYIYNKFSGSEHKILDKSEGAICLSNRSFAWTALVNNFRRL